MVEAFAAQFRDRAFISYVRTPGSVELDQAGSRAAETGRWVAQSTGGDGPSGTYLACWRKVTGQWLIESELFITLAE